jgi:hypothetical protein
MALGIRLEKQDEALTWTQPRAMSSGTITSRDNLE